MEGKNSRNNFYRRTRIDREKNVGIKIVGKKCEKCFLYSYESRDQKKLGKKRAKQFFQKHTKCAIKKCWEKMVGKSAKNVFYIHTKIISKKWGQKTRETIFTEAHE